MLSGPVVNSRWQCYCLLNIAVLKGLQSRPAAFGEEVQSQSGDSEEEN